MTFEAYETVVEDSGYEARGRERQALSLGIDRLERLQKEQSFSIEDQVQSLLYVRRLWTIFIEDLAHPENGLPEQLRADIISIGLWVVKETDRLREERSNDVMQLVEINRLIRDAL
jgi:flagellar protein FlaF